MRTSLILVGQVGVACLLFITSSASATLIDAITVPIGGDVDPGSTIFLGTKTTGISLTNLSGNTGFVQIEALQGPPRGPNDGIQDGFELLDGTLRITSNIPDGEKRVRIRIGYSEQRLGRAGLRAGSQRLFRRVRTTGGRAIWERAVRAIRGRATGRRFIRSAPVPSLGNWGFDASDSFVWGFLDVTSDYAVGARKLVEPASLLLVGSGLGLLLWSGRRKP